MSLTAVVIDDSSTTRSRLKSELVKSGFTVVAESASGETAIALYEKHHPTLVMLDIVLPGVDGVTVATQLLSKHPEAKVVMCSSITARDKILACRVAGVKHFILKPFSSEKIAEVLRTLFNLDKQSDRQGPLVPVS
jgi:two-component system chemotaxis response regulator CheY